ncbi:MAG TPA: FAD binding domain-containing protein, partial [Casimicrobiaceae bacterium]|nr:FAD binding domain-containing protein [Casimicrobiaceae bacterium]
MRAVRMSGPQSVQFILDGRLVRVAGAPPQTTLLEYLREDLGRTGTKEGCAEGDCGACTVVLGELDGDTIRWRPVNACIRLLPTIDGKAVVTVESLKSPDGALHPVQQALVDCHASQCGFCTPGFAMSLFALYKSARLADRAAIDEALSGNLCRCTGYRPIIAAAERMHALPPAAGWRGPGADAQGRLQPSDDERALATQLARLRRESTFELEVAGQRYFAPVAADELARLCMAHPDARLVGGATDVGLWVTKQHRDLGTIIHTGLVHELCNTAATADELVIGAAVPLTDAFELIGRHYPSLAEIGSRFGSVPIRNSGTLGGNVANGSPIGDSMPVLLALG